jgi:hypothetical protein
MKFLRLLLVALTAGIVFTSCQKELSAETGSAIGALAKDPAGNCAPIGINGAYKKDTVLNATNFVDIQLDVTNVGIYIISTDTVNGYYFRATGVTPLPGANSIRLVGFGKPIAVGTDNFTVKFGGTVCEFDVPVTLGTGGGGGTTAVFTLGSTVGACTGFTLGAGTYTPGTALGASNTVTLNVNVTTPGTYTINATTTAATGVVFTATGSFPSGTTGAATITLTAQPGTGNTGNSPNNTVAIPTASYDVTAGGTTCSFIVPFNAPVSPATYSITCTGITSAGTYTPGIALGASNSVTLNVNVVTPGSYTLSATTTASTGVIFSATGSFPSGTTGATTITLTALPAPGNTGNSPTNTVAIPNASYSVTVGGTTCSFTVPFNAPPPPPPPAIYNVICAGITSAGTYTAAVPLTSSETVTIQVNATVAGLYNIATDVQNGVKFVSSGSLLLGNNTVTLRAATSNNTPGATPTTSTFTIAGSTCTFPITFAAAPVVTAIFSCSIDGTPYTFTTLGHAEVDDIFTGAFYLYLTGYGSPLPGTNDQTHFQIFITKNDGTAVGVGSYNENGFLTPGYRIEIDYTAQNPDLSTTIWNTSSNLFPPNHPPFVINVINSSSTIGGRVKGNFSGSLTNTLGGSTLFKTITNGVFDLVIQ